jgi:hypothetical protein
MRLTIARKPLAVILKQFSLVIEFCGLKKATSAVTLLDPGSGVNALFRPNNFIIHPSNLAMTSLSIGAQHLASRFAISGRKTGTNYPYGLRC